MCISSPPNAPEQRAGGRREAESVERTSKPVQRREDGGVSLDLVMGGSVHVQNSLDLVVRGEGKYLEFLGGCGARGGGREEAGISGMLASKKRIKGWDLQRSL